MSVKNKIDCFDKIKVGNLKDEFEKLIKEGMSLQEQRDIGTKLALGYHQKLFNDLEGFKKLLNIKSKEKYVSPDKSAIVKKIQDDYQSKINEASIKKPEPKQAEEKPQPQKPITEDKPTTEKEISTKAKELADKVRKLKIDLSKLSGGGLQSNPLGLPIGVWNASMDIIAKTIEAGGTIADAIKRGLNHIQKNHRGQWDKKGFNDQVMKELGVRGITVNGEDLVVKDSGREFAETVNGWYSDLEQSVLDVKGEKGSGESWKKILGNSDEAKWTGLNDWLSQQKEPVTKKQIQDFLKDNRIQVVEVVKGGEGDILDYESAPKEVQKVIDKHQNGDIDSAETIDKLRELGYEAQYDMDFEISGITKIGNEPTKFSQYQLEGQKENYKEVLVTLPTENKLPEGWTVRVRDNITEGTKDRPYGVYDPEGKMQYTASTEARAKALLREYEKTEPTKFQSSHFDEPNILVHLRMNTRTDADGKKVLFLEEVQSDWGQKGKKEGFRNPISEKDIRVKFFPPEVPKGHDPSVYPGYWESYDNRTGEMITRHPGSMKESEVQKDALKAYQAFFEKNQIQQAPFVTETPSWTKLGLKVALKEAVKQGADKIAWTTGEQQNDRYNLRKQVEEIQYVYGDGGRDILYGYDKAGDQIFLKEISKDASEKEIENLIGKEAAKKLLEQEAEEVEYIGKRKTIKGEQLEVGGKGMKGFYGSPSEGKLGIVGEVAKSLFKQEPKTTELTEGKWKEEDGRQIFEGADGTYIGDYSKQRDGSFRAVDMFGREKKFDKESDAKDYIYNSTNFHVTQQHSIDITPEMKAEVEGGLPLFKDIKGRGKEIADLLRKGKIKMGGLQSNIAGIPIAIYNAAIETIALALEGGATLTQAIQKAINKHKLNQQKGFNQKEFISKLEDATGEKFTDDQQQPPPPQTPKQEPKEVGGDMGGKKKAVLNRLYNAKNVPQSAKEGFEREGLTYKPKSQKEAAEIAKSILDEFGVDEAVELADSSSMFEGDVRTLIFAEALDRLQGEENAARWAEVAIAMDKFERSAGRAASAVNYFYKNNPYGVQLKEEADRKDAFNKWATPQKEKSWKEFFEEFKNDAEFQAYFKEQVYEERKKERAKSRQGRIKKVREVFAKAKASVSGKGAAYSAIIPPNIITGALDVMEKLYEAGEAVAEVIQRGIDYINKEYGTSWDSQKFREEWEEKLKESTKAPLTEEELKKKVLDKFRNRLKGLSDKQRDDVVRRMFDKVVNAGALEYDDLRDIIADVLGYGKLTADEGKRLQELVKKRNAVGDAAKKVQEERTEKSLEEYRLSEIEAGKAARELQELLWNKPDIIKRLTSIMQLSTLGIPSLINNPIYNFFNQLGVRFPVGLINSTIDKFGSVIARAMGKQYFREYNIFDGQAEFWSKLGAGSKESIQQLWTGLNRQDYIQKEYYGQQIRPMRALRDLIRWKAGEKKLTKAQVIDKALQASVGVPAEVVARFLNIGDKPQRFAAEGSQAAAFAKALGLKGIDKKIFIEFPKEEAYRAYKAQGLSDEAASTKAEYIKEAIIKEGQRSTFQQDNLLNDAITRFFGVFGGKDSGVANLTKTLTVSPYIKIPSNAFWSYYNLVNPEVAILQSFYHAGRAKIASNKGDDVSAKLQMREARYWFAHAMTGVAVRGLVIFLVQAGVFVAGNTGDESKKERDAESFFELPGSINVTKLWALMRGEDPKKVKGGVLVSNRWFGQFGTVGNSVARKWEDMTPEQRENQQEFWNIAFGGMELEGLKEMQNGIFANTSSLLDIVNTGDFSRYGLNSINMFANILQPASIAQINRASLNEVPQVKGDTFLEKLNQNFAQRSDIYRKAFNVQLQQKRSMWGEPMPRGGNVLSRMFGISKIDEKKEGRPMYEDYMRTNDIGFLPPAVLPTLNKQELNQKQYNLLQDYIGQSRKAIALPYINDEAVIPIIGKKYSELNDKDGKPNYELRKAVLQYLYQLGRDNGVDKFYKIYPEFKKEEKSIEQQVEESLLDAALEIIKLQNKQY